MTQPTETNNPQQLEKASRVIDLRIPLPWLITGLVSICFTLISMWFNTNQLLKDVADLQITMKTGNSQTTTLAGEVALLRFRIENIENDRKISNPVGK